MSMSDHGRQSALDRPAARAIAVVVLAGVAGALVYIHRDDLFPPDPVAAAAPDTPFALCVAERHADIDQMIADGHVDEQKAAVFKQRAEALCRAQHPE